VDGGADKPANAQQLRRRLCVLDRASAQLLCWSDEATWRANAAPIDKVDCWAVDGIETSVVTEGTEDTGAARVSHHLLRLTLHSGRPKHRVILLASPDVDAIAGWIRAIVACGAVPPTARALGSAAALRLAAQQLRERAALAPKGISTDFVPDTSLATLPVPGGVSSGVTSSCRAGAQGHPAPPPGVLRCGWLLKKRDHLSGRNRRWFVLYAGTASSTAARGGGEEGDFSGAGGVKASAMAGGYAEAVCAVGGGGMKAHAHTVPPPPRTQHAEPLLSGASLVYFSSLSDDSPRGVVHLSSVSVSLLKATDAPSGVALVLKPVKRGKSINLATEGGNEDAAAWLQAIAQHTAGGGTAQQTGNASTAQHAAQRSAQHTVNASTAHHSAIGSAASDAERVTSAPPSSNGPPVAGASSAHSTGADSPPSLDGSLLARLWLEEAALSSLIDGVASRALQALVTPAAFGGTETESGGGGAEIGAGAARPEIDGGKASHGLGPAQPRMETRDGAAGGAAGEGSVGGQAARIGDGGAAVNTSEEGVNTAGGGVKTAGERVNVNGAVAGIEAAASPGVAGAHCGDEATSACHTAGVAATAPSLAGTSADRPAACGPALPVANGTDTSGARPGEECAGGSGVTGRCGEAGVEWGLQPK
jgi:hypothetical protein